MWKIVAMGGCSSGDGGFNYAGVFGQGIIAQAANTFHVECLDAVNTPSVYSEAWPIGTIFMSATPPGATCVLPLYIKII